MENQTDKTEIWFLWETNNHKKKPLIGLIKKEGEKSKKAQCQKWESRDPKHCKETVIHKFTPINLLKKQRTTDTRKYGKTDKKKIKIYKYKASGPNHQGHRQEKLAWLLVCPQILRFVCGSWLALAVPCHHPFRLPAPAPGQEPPAFQRPWKQLPVRVRATLWSKPLCIFRWFC